MNIISTRIASALAGAALLASVGTAYAVDVGAGVSIGGSNGINGGLGASIGGSGGTNAGAGASIGGTNGVNGGAGASIGGTNGTNGGAGVTIGGTNGVNAGAGVNLGGGTIVNPGTGPSNSSTGISTSSIKSDASTSTSATGRFNINGMSAKEMARYKRRCVDILANRSSYDNDLVALCQAIR